MFSFSSKGDFAKTEAWLRRLSNGNVFATLNRFGQEGINALSSATPVETGQTAGSWTFEIESSANSYSIIWGNTHIEAGRPIAVMLQLGHGTGTGGYVQGRDYINPAMRPIFDRIAEEAWRAVTQ